jgi:putative colanic acid biosysnthesis UDP-glucose lipid carrier transferase
MRESGVRSRAFVVSTTSIATVQAIAPAFIAVLCLYALLVLFGIPLASYYHFLALAVALAGLIILRLPRQPTGRFIGQAFPVVVAVTTRWLLVLAVLLALGYVTKFSSLFARRVVLSWVFVAPAMIVVSMLALQELQRRLWRDPSRARQAVIAGCTHSSAALAQRLAARCEYGISVLGFFDDRGPERLEITAGAPLLGRLSDLPRFVKAHAPEVVFVALPVRQVSRVMSLLDELQDTTASVYCIPDIYVFDLIQSRGEVLEGIPVISMCETPFYGHRAAAKRLTDVVLTIAILLVIAPVMAVIALAVRLSSPGPVIFRQRRYGLNGQEITIYKFRTMTVQEDGPEISQVTEYDARVTLVGRFLRRHSLDELPQLINVLQGRMSLVGPRPHAVAHNEIYRKLIKGYMVRHKVLPGITGLAQVNGLRGETRTVEQMEARIRYDLEYLRCWSIELDIEILARTALRLISDAAAY